MPGKLRERANISGGEIRGANLIDNATFIVDESTARPPSHYRALAAGQGKEYVETKRVARATVSAGGSSVAGDLRTRAPVDTAEPVVQKYRADDGEWRRKSTNESNWSGWIKQFDETNKPSLAAGDITGAGTAAQADTGSASGNVPAFFDDGILRIPRDVGDSLSAPTLTFSRTKPAGFGVAGDWAGLIEFSSEQASPGGNQPFGKIICEVVDPNNASLKSRFLFRTIWPSGGGSDTRFAIGAGAYTWGTTDNGFDTITADQFYIEPDSAPSNPPVGGTWVLYVDAGDGNKLKAKASNGTVVTLGTP